MQCTPLMGYGIRGVHRGEQQSPSTQTSIYPPLRKQQQNSYREPLKKRMHAFMRCIALINLIVYRQFIPNILIREERTKVVSIELSSGYIDAAQNFNYTFFFPDVLVGNWYHCLFGFYDMSLNLFKKQSGYEKYVEENSFSKAISLLLQKVRRSPCELVVPDCDCGSSSRHIETFKTCARKPSFYLFCIRQMRASRPFLIEHDPNIAKPASQAGRFPVLLSKSK